MSRFFVFSRLPPPFDTNRHNFLNPKSATKLQTPPPPIKLLKIAKFIYFGLRAKKKKSLWVLYGWGNWWKFCKKSDVARFQTPPPPCHKLSHFHIPPPPLPPYNRNILYGQPLYRLCRIWQVGVLAKTTLKFSFTKSSMPHLMEQLLWLDNDSFVSGLFTEHK